MWKEQKFPLNKKMHFVGHTPFCTDVVRHMFSYMRYNTLFCLGLTCKSYFNCMLSYVEQTQFDTYANELVNNSTFLKTPYLCYLGEGFQFTKAIIKAKALSTYLSFLDQKSIWNFPISYYRILFMNKIFRVLQETDTNIPVEYKRPEEYESPFVIKFYLLCKMPYSYDRQVDEVNVFEMFLTQDFTLKRVKIVVKATFSSVYTHLESKDPILTSKQLLDRQAVMSIAMNSCDLNWRSLLFHTLNFSEKK
jgi:hypothetical protein